jgi:NADPH-dependent 2,4-dienoyl-CoA reductase/sulfur reductase-like enzyme
MRTSQTVTEHRWGEMIHGEWLKAFVAIVRDGLQPQVVRPKRVVVVGAGMAGLVAAYELLRRRSVPSLR